MTLEEIFNNCKLTENGDESFKSTGNKLLDILFTSEYLQRHLNEVKIGDSDLEKLFACFMRDPRHGMGFRDLGRELMNQANVHTLDVIKAGRYDDLFYKIWQMPEKDFNLLALFLYSECASGNELCKKWMPRYSSKNLMLARKFAKAFGMNKQTYGKFIKCDTTEQKLSRKDTDSIAFDKIPSLALLKYTNRFASGKDTAERWQQYLNDVKEGKKKINTSVATVYDIYKHANEKGFDPDLYFAKMPKIQGSWLPIVDTSGSMEDSNDSIGKALAIGHYLAKCSTYAPDTVVSFSSRPQLLKLGFENAVINNWTGRTTYQELRQYKSKYMKEIKSMYTGDCSNTDFGAVMKLIKNLDPANAPEYLVVLSDMEFDQGSSQSKDETMRLFKQNGINTKILWWNLNSRNVTCPETDTYGNIFMSGYNPMLLQYLEAGFNGYEFLMKLLEEYKNKMFVKMK